MCVWGGGQVSNTERKGKRNTNQLTREKKRRRERNGSGFYHGAEGALRGDASIVSPKLRVHRAKPLLLARFSALLRVKAAGLGQIRSPVTGS